MATIDPDLERQRLVALYSGMNDGELEKLAASMTELTSVASSVLSVELSRRGLSATPAADIVDLEPSELVTIRKFEELHDASLAKGSIESAGIECFLAGAYTIGHVTPVRLQVQRSDVEEAKEILDQPIPESFEVEGVGKFEQPRCPVCSSIDVSFEGWTQSAADMLAHVGLPQPYRHAWKCQVCNHVWPDGNPEA